MPHFGPKYLVDPAFLPANIFYEGLESNGLKIWKSHFVFEDCVFGRVVKDFFCGLKYIKKEHIRLIICTIFQSFLMIHQHYPLSYLSSNRIHVQSQQNGRRDAWRLVKITSIKDIVKSSRTSNKFTIYSSFFTDNFEHMVSLLIAFTKKHIIISIAHRMHFVNLMNPHRYNILSIILLLGYIPFSLGSICNCWIFLNEDTSSLKQIEQMCKCVIL